ncbi:hypothetical protein VZT92_022701 [Zoarces viviparus]|uniref:Uncharacterized protein n=1 Tax=Zoarces viviparus TaxID=48416 RepID=A0AAW1EEE0_ZOAVI
MGCYSQHTLGSQSSHGKESEQVAHHRHESSTKGWKATSAYLSPAPWRKQEYPEEKQVLADCCAVPRE